MVHALLECWRVLQPGGALIDLRPVHSNPPLDLIVGGEIHIVGAINDEGGAPDDEASDAALDETVRRGYFTREGQSAFDFDYFWESLDDLLAYADEKWRDFSYVPADVVRRARDDIAGTRGSYKARIRRRMQLGVYRKTLPGLRAPGSVRRAQ